MEILKDLGIILVCILAIGKGAAWLVDSAAKIAKRLGISELIIGLTVVAFGTSAPELMVTLDAVLTGAPGLGLGNIIGSNIANVLLILGVCFLVSPITGSPHALKRDGVVLIVGSAVFAILCAQGGLGLGSGVVLFVLFIGFLVSSYRFEARDENAATEHIQEVEEIGRLPGPKWLIAPMVIGGLAGVIWGADLLVNAGVEIARDFGISEEIIGLTLIAFGTSLPELAASVVAAYRGHSDIAVGNIVGSNLFNILGIAGLAAMVAPLPVADKIMDFDIWVMLGATVLVLPILAGRWRLNRPGAALFLILYGAYIAANGYSAGLFGGG
ncbi:MAG: calcium/sodium antiporter [Proteobacteria bacterium]|nr:calcium/sodium antiporter [Pseudomonadota bacterium]